MTDLWMVRIDRPMRQAESEALLALLPQERRNRLHGHALEKQPEVLCAYGLLLALLRKRCGWQGFPAVARNAEDKPFFPAYPGVCFSISHTEGAAAAAVAETSIGVDIQRIQTPAPAACPADRHRRPGCVFPQLGAAGSLRQANRGGNSAPAS